MSKGKPKTGGALRTEPKGFQLGADQASLQKQQQIFQQRADKKGENSKAYKNLQKVNSALGALNTAPSNPALPQNPVQIPSPDVQQGWNDVSGRSNDYMSNIFGQLQNQGQFNPGDYGQQRQQAMDSVMSEFNRTMQPQFDKEQGDFRQRMAEQGIPENSEKYKYLETQMQNQQQGARQGAMNQGYGLGMQEQQQGYGQAAQTYQMPLNQLNAVSPFYGYQNQMNMQQGQQQWASGENQMDRTQQGNLAQGGYDFQKELAKLQHGYNMQLQASAPRGGGGGGSSGLSYEQQLGLVDRNFYNNMVLQGVQNGQQMPYPGAAGGAVQGVGAGVAAGLGSALR